MQKYAVNQHLINSVLGWVQAGEIAIPEIQRPFVWNATQVRDLIDSLYNGYPIGYLIAWKNPNIRLKDGSISEGKKILIDGQQRVVALITAIMGQKIIDKNYQKVRVKIAFHPSTEKFEVTNTAIERDNDWISDISILFKPNTNILQLVESYCKKNTESDRDKVFQTIGKLNNITSKQIGFVELSPDLDIETVTEIFIRINSKGVVLSQADFAMSKIASNDRHDGSNMRKCIDYFCHLAVAPEFYNQIGEIDKKFTKTKFFPKMRWLKNEIDDLYDPKYTDMVRVAFTKEFNRGRLRDLVSLLSGRNFETRKYEEKIEKESFRKLKRGLYDFMNETNFKRFVMIIKSAGFNVSSLIRSQNALNFAYILYLKLKSRRYNPNEIEKYVRKWFVLSILTGRYSGSAESLFDFDIKNISRRNFGEYLKDIESAELSDAYWNSRLIQNLDSSVASSPYFNVFLAAQVKHKNKGFLSTDISVSDMLQHRGDIHHIFPAEYLKKKGLTRNRYNQIANYVLMQSEINIKIGYKAPKEYFKDLRNQIKKRKKIYGGIIKLRDLKKNLADHCIPENIVKMDYKNYDTFLEERRQLMAKKIKTYYKRL